MPLPHCKRLGVALWETLALPDERDPLAMPPAPKPPAPAVPPMTPAQEIHADYGTTGLSLKGHPIQLIRAELNRRGVLPAVEVWKPPWPVGARRRHRHHPPAPRHRQGIVFETIEDETGVTNLIIHPPVFDRYRNAARMRRWCRPMDTSNAREKCSTSWSSACTT